ncbi:MAG: hypothetical protein QOC82_1742, partial [Frankiaceae bacterium]|nr:hypothetical protein [Frankiaceae bacterium]
ATWRAIPVLMSLAGLTLAIWLGVHFVDRADDTAKPLTQLEQLFFGIYTLVVGAALSWMASAFYAARQTQSQFQQLARPALRRVLAARDSADAVLQAIDRRRKAARKLTAAEDEALQSLHELVDQHARVLEDAVSDWQEVLPAEVQAVQIFEARRAYNTEVRQLNDQMDSLRDALAALAAAPTIDPKHLSAQLTNLTKELESLRRKVNEPRPYELISTASLVGTPTIRLTSSDSSIRVDESGRVTVVDPTTRQ